jgi:hypothetical protein
MAPGERLNWPLLVAGGAENARLPPIISQERSQGSADLIILCRIKGDAAVLMRF